MFSPVQTRRTFEEAVERTSEGLLSEDVFFTIGSGDIDRAGPIILDKLRGSA